LLPDLVGYVGVLLKLVARGDRASLGEAPDEATYKPHDAVSAEETGNDGYKSSANLGDGSSDCAEGHEEDSVGKAGPEAPGKPCAEKFVHLDGVALSDINTTGIGTGDNTISCSLCALEVSHDPDGVRIRVIECEDAQEDEDSEEGSDR